MTEPVTVEPVPVYLLHDKLREINVVTKEFASLASQWIANKNSAKDFEEKPNLPNSPMTQSEFISSKSSDQK